MKVTLVKRDGSTTTEDVVSVHITTESWAEPLKVDLAESLKVAEPSVQLGSAHGVCIEPIGANVVRICRRRS